MKRKSLLNCIVTIIHVPVKKENKIIIQVCKLDLLKDKQVPYRSISVKKKKASCLLITLYLSEKREIIYVNVLIKIFYSKAESCMIPQTT